MMIKRDAHKDPRPSLRSVSHARRATNAKGATPLIRALMARAARRHDSCRTQAPPRDQKAEHGVPGQTNRAPGLRFDALNDQKI